MRSRAAAPVLVTVLLLVLPEVVLRVVGWPPPEPEAMLPSDPDTVWALRPGDKLVLGAETNISSSGLRGPERGTKPAGVRRIAFLGDSSVFGVLVDDPDTFPDQLARLLPGVEPLNAGVPGFSSEQCRRHLDKRVLALAPDVVVIASLWSDNNFDGFVDRELLAGRATLGARAAAGLLGMATFRALATYAGKHTQSIGWGVIGGSTLAGKRRVDLDDYAENLDAMVASAASVGAEPLFLMLANIEDLERAARPWSWDPYRDAMRTAARRHGTAVVDVPAAWRASGRGRALLLDDMHPSVEGHRLIAEALAAALTARGWDRGEPLVRDPTGEPRHDLVDPWTEPAPPGATSPRVTGIVSGKPGLRDPLRVELVGPSGAVLDAVSLPGPGPFALDTDAPAATLRVLVGRTNAREERLTDAALDLSGGPVWALGVDLATGNVTRKGNLLAKAK